MRLVPCAGSFGWLPHLTQQWAHRAATIWWSSISPATLGQACLRLRIPARCANRLDVRGEMPPATAAAVDKARFSANKERGCGRAT